jgi:UDP:flavonoid glycosyltransferase YjiC (YdhE family)
LIGSFSDAEDGQAKATEALRAELAADRNDSMATILLAWELGGGLGHLMKLRPLADVLSQRGHRVVAVVRDLSSARRLLPSPEVVILQAPIKHQRTPEIEPTCTFAQILHNCGFGEVEELATLCEAWRRLYEYVEPDLIVFEHSPSALLAARGYSARRVVIGTGFLCPPDAAPLPNLRIWMKPDARLLLAHEARVLENINLALGRLGEQQIDRVSRLYHPIDETFLLTFQELDCYPRHGDAIYWGAWSAGLGVPPRWPPGRGQKIFAYLKPFPALAQLLAAVNGLPNPILIFAPGIDPRLRDQCRNPTVRFVDQPVEMAQAARECDLAILNGTHATTVAMLLAGKPALHIPIFLEQAINARAAERLGAAVTASPNEPKQIIDALRSLLSRDQFAKAAQTFAARYAAFDPTIQIQRLVDRAEELAMSRAG